VKRLHKFAGVHTRTWFYQSPTFPKGRYARYKTNSMEISPSLRVKVAYLRKKSPPFYDTLKFSSVFARCLNRTFYEPDESSPHLHPISPRVIFNIIIPLKSRYSYWFPILRSPYQEPFCAFLFPSMRATWTIKVIILLTFVEKCKSWSSSSCTTPEGIHGGYNV
jgi:hypothetical protein